MRPTQPFTHQFSQTAPGDYHPRSECVFFYDDQQTLLNRKSIIEAFPDASSILSSIDQALDRSGFKGKIAQVRSFDASILRKTIPNVVCLGIGNATCTRETPALQKAAVALAKHVKGSKTHHLYIAWPNTWMHQDIRHLQDIITGLNIGLYQFGYFQQNNTPSPLNTLEHLGVDDAFATSILPSLCADEGQNFAKNLMHEPTNVLTPLHFADLLKTLTNYGVEVNVLDEQALSKENMHALLSVGKASTNRPCLVTMRWKPSNTTHEKPIALVGKGICFDTGGINLKPSAGLADMKYDMGGAAAVAGTMLALAKANSNSHVVGVVALAENSVHGNAMRPSDIISSRAGKSICVLNTDAEGRLILADAIDYTIDVFQPKTLIDLATLTGAMVIALGYHRAGLFSHDEHLVNALMYAGKATGEKLWRMPLGDDYKKMIESSIADIQNLGSPDRAAGSITAAEFIAAFIKHDVSWAHLDIAGTAFKPSDELHGKGPTGFGVHLLIEAIHTLTSTKS